MQEIPHLYTERRNYQIPLPKIFEDLKSLCLKEVKSDKQKENRIQELFPHTFSKPFLEIVTTRRSNTKPKKVGVVFSGGQASGGHNVIAGLYDALNKLNTNNSLFGFLGGPSGIIEGRYKELKKEDIDQYRNIGGFDMIGSGRTKIETPDQLKASLKTIVELNLDGFVIIGGDDSNTNAAILAEFFENQNKKISVIGIPKTIDGDLKNEYIEISFGFDTACKIYSEMIGNILTDALSAKKYYHFIKLMGRSASHIALECAFQTHANITLIGEEISDKKMTLKNITHYLCDIICKRAVLGKNYGAILIPEGLIEFIPEIKQLISELNKLLATHTDKFNEISDFEEKKRTLPEHLSTPSKACLDQLPNDIAEQLLLDRDPHGNVQVARINTEQLLIKTVSIELKKRQNAGNYSGKFSALAHYFGYEGRSAYPTNFDANYCYGLGYLATILINAEVNGYLACLKNLKGPVNDWQAFGLPINTFIHLEKRHGKLKPVIEKALVKLDALPFTEFAKIRESWALEDHYRSPGPIQYFGNRTLTDTITFTLQYEQSK